MFHPRSAISTSVYNSGVQTVYAGATVTDTTVNSGGNQNISSGGIVSETTVNVSGTQNIYSEEVPLVQTLRARRL